MVSQWKAAMASDWRAIRDFLARRYPERWSPTNKLYHAGENLNQVQVNHKIDVKVLLAQMESMTDGQLESLERLIEVEESSDSDNTGTDHNTVSA